MPSNAHPTVRDCPPGTSCSMVAAVEGSSLAVLVTEPTPFGLHDLEAAVGTLEWLGIPHSVVINKCDLGFEDTEKFCRRKGIPVIGRIPFTQEIARLVSEGKLLVNEGEAYRRTFGEIVRRIFSGEARTAKRDMHAPDAEDKTIHDVFGRCKDRRAAQNIKNIIVISGKGGTGKTTLAASFSALLEDKVVADCDVDAANLHLLVDSRLVSSGYFRSSYMAEIDPGKCTACGKCAQACRFDAITMAQAAVVDPLKCEGCGLCELVCPLAESEETNPVTIRENVDGEAYQSVCRHGDFVHAKLYPGGEASGKLVTLLRGMAEKLAVRNGLSKILIDASPGVGSPVNASIVGADLALIVTEPSMSALHDLQRVLRLTKFFGTDAQVVINRVDLNPEVVSDIESVCERAGVEIVGRIPFDRQIVEAMTQGVPPVLYAPCGSKDVIADIFEKVFGELKGVQNAKR